MLVLTISALHQLLITRKMAYYKQKRDRWVAQGRLPADASDWDAVKVSPAFGARTRTICSCVQ